MWTRRLALGCGLLAVGVAACEIEVDDPAAAVTTGITGTVVVATGGAVDAGQAEVAAYAGRAEFDAGVWLRRTIVGRDGARWTFDLELDPGAYWLDVWKDTDGDGRIGGSDLYGFYSDRASGPPAAIAVGDGRVDITIEVRTTPRAPVSATGRGSPGRNPSG